MKHSQITPQTAVYQISMSLSTNIWVFTFVLCSSLITKATPQPHCPMHCSSCLPSYIACTGGGLQSIPVQLQPGTEKIILAGQFQFQGVLTSANFSELAPPKYNIQYLSIRSSSVQELRQQTFSKLTNLKNLDLSENQRLTIMHATFDGLHLKHLKLDDIGKLMLAPGCFIGLVADSLSMKNSRLQSLNYDIFEPISYTLKHLFIENNQIRTLDQRFEPLFYRLESVNLKDNPLICYCPLLWLSKALKSKSSSQIYQTLIDEDQLNSVDSNSFPKCVAPSYLRNRQVQSITEGEFNCLAPRIYQIEVDIISLQNGELICRILPDEKGHKIPTKIFWQESQSLVDNYVRFVRNSQTADDRVFSEDSEIRDLSATIKIDPNSFTSKRSFECIAENTAGRSTISVHISWPLQSYFNKSLVMFPNGTNMIKISDLSRNQKNSNSNTPDSYLFTKHYTLLEMTVAIIGTFVITILIFLLFYKFYFRQKNLYKCGKPTMKYSLNGESPYSNKRSLMAFHSPRAGYTVYETSMHYSDNSQTYDSIPQNAVYPHQQQPLFSTLPNSPSAHFIDYKTHKNVYPSPPSA